jgi:predicted nucleic acid-binding protein
MAACFPRRASNLDLRGYLGLARLGLRQGPVSPSGNRSASPFQEVNQRYLTTDFVINELISSLFARAPFDEARRFVDGLFLSFERGRHQLVFVTPDQFHEAYRLRLTFHDKLDISFVDLTSMAVMRDQGITEVFTGDIHFRRVGMGFRLYP